MAGIVAALLTEAGNFKQTNRHMKKALLAIVSICLAAGCGGGSGGPQVLRPTVPPPAAGPLSWDLPDVRVVHSPTPAESADAGALKTFYAGYFQNSLLSVPFNLINLGEAYANIYGTNGAAAAGRPGNAVTIGFIDTGLDTQHSAFAGKRVSVEYLEGTYAGSDLASAGDRSHGTSVASIAAGVRQEWSSPPVTSEGVAPGAPIRMFTIPLGSGPPAVNAPTEDLLKELMIDDPEPYVAALNSALGVDVLNMSFGISGSIENYSEETLRAAFGKTIETLAQEGRSDKTILVRAAGNENGSPCVAGSPGCEGGFFNGSSPGFIAALQAKIPELRGHSVAVVATLPISGVIAGFSNRCGIAAEWCIAAPGQSVLVAFSGTRNDGSIARTLSSRSGTSYSAPIVAGGLALMKQRFRNQLSNTQLLSRMFETANSSGIYADKAIYGHGLLDLGAATGPVGTMMVAAAGEGGLNDENRRRFATLSTTQVETGEAFGDGIARAFAGREIAGFDSLGAPFWYPLDAFALRTEKSAVREQLVGFMDFSKDKTARGGSVSVTGGEVSAPLLAYENGQGKKSGVTDGGIPSVYVSMARGSINGPGRLNKSGHLSFVEHPVSFGIESDNFAVSAFTSDERGERGARGAVVFYRPASLPLGFRSGYISESNSALGATAEGGFGGVSASTVFAAVGWDYKIGGWQVVADAEVGIAAPETNAGLISDVSRLKTSSFSAGVIRRFSGGSAIRVSVSSPLRIENGRMGLTIPTGRTPEGVILRDAIRANLEPSGRQIDFAAQVVAQTRAGKVSIGGVASREPGHNENADTSLSLLAGYSMNF